MTKKIEWSDFNKFEKVDEYLPSEGEGETKATQISTAVSKLIYKWFNDGDTPDNVHSLKGWYNDLSDYANWLQTNIDEFKGIYRLFVDCSTDDDYAQLLFKICKKTEEKGFMEKYDSCKKVGSVYDCYGPFQFVK